MKPKIKQVTYAALGPALILRHWVCSDSWCMAIGSTPIAAYENYLAKIRGMQNQ